MSFLAVKELDLYIIYGCDLHDWKNLALLNHNSYHVMNMIKDYRIWVSINHIVIKNLKFFGYDRIKFTPFDKIILNNLTLEQKNENLNSVINERKRIMKYLLFDEACRHRSLHIVKYFAPHIHISSERIADMFSICCINDDLCMFEFSLELGYNGIIPIDLPYHFLKIGLFDDMIKHNSISILEWLTKHDGFGQHDFQYIFDKACRMNNVGIAKFILEKFTIDVSSQLLYSLFKDACRSGHRDMAEWLLGLGSIDTAFNNYEIYRITTFDYIKQWLHQYVYGFIPACDSIQVEPKYRWFISYDEYFYTAKHSPNFEKCVEPKERHPRKMLTKYPKNNKLCSKNKKLYR